MEYEGMMEAEKLNQSQLANKLGISRVRVNQILNLLKLPQKKQKYIMENGKDKIITERMLRNKNILKQITK